MHLEALKLGIEPMMSSGAPKTLIQRIAGWGMGIAGTILVMAAIYYIGVGVQAVAGEAAIWILLALLLALYIYLLKVSAKYPDLPTDINITSPVKLETWPTVRSGLYFLIPIGILVWCLSIEMLSAGLSAFYSVLALLFLLITQRPIIAFFRHQDIASETKQGVREAFQGLEEGARNMIGIAIACGTAGLIVGAITLTGLGLRMTAFVELVSMGNVLVMLFFTAAVCLVLGLGMPTTANYILMATLMAPVIVELGAQSGLIIPLIAVHFFVFYFGIMADITPPVGLATFAAAAISGEDPLKTGLQGVTYALRTAVLPFIFVFNPMLLLIGVNTWFHLIAVVVGVTVASMVFAAASLRWFRTKCTWLEALVLLIASFMLFRPDWYMNRMYSEYVSLPVTQVYSIAANLPEDGRFVAKIEGMNLEGDELTKLVAVNLPALETTEGRTEEQVGRERLRLAGLSFMGFGDMMQVANVRFGSQAFRASWEQGWDVKDVMIPNPDRPSETIIFIPGLLLIIAVWLWQGRRLRVKKS